MSTHFIFLSLLSVVIYFKPTGAQNGNGGPIVNNVTDPSTITECGTTSFTWQNTSVNGQSFAPGTTYGFGMGVFQVNNAASLFFSGINDTSFTAKIPFAAGPSPTFSYAATANNSDLSLSQNFTISSGSDQSCSLAFSTLGQSAIGIASAPIFQNLQPSSQTCSSTLWEWTAGIPPFQFRMLWSLNDLDVMFILSNINTRQVSIKLPIPSGVEYNVTVTDSNGVAGSAGPVTMSAGDDTSCLLSFSAGSQPTDTTPTPSPTSTNPPAMQPVTPGNSQSHLPVIIGAAIGGALLLGIAASFAIALNKRRHRQPSNHVGLVVTTPDIMDYKPAHSNSSSLQAPPQEVPLMIIDKSGPTDDDASSIEKARPDSSTLTDKFAPPNLPLRPQSIHAQCMRPQSVIIIPETPHIVESDQRERANSLNSPIAPVGQALSSSHLSPASPAGSLSKKPSIARKPAPKYEGELDVPTTPSPVPTIVANSGTSTPNIPLSVALQDTSFSQDHIDGAFMLSLDGDTDHSR